MLQVTALSKEHAELCPVRQVLSQVTGKWQVLIILSLEDGGQRFGALRRTIGDVTQRVLTENLRKLERDGYLTRTVDPGPPVSVTYALTDLGEELLGHLKNLAGWAAKSHAAVVENRASYDAQ
ncbi:MAG: winged helix-turn-helix transcriptional regulator [Cognatishimia sp.]|uniref:winged helix-turn-helix transcriptional regulator n=1 Tax=Cognatishimia sp. 1_MG-2023 TaxID=3062642 RepID=UPI0026E188AD|nr:helix-turn-helix domain-containing protein [Cognatishimia sp. 1_MG-2023]MDO6727025.1 helix-turn-helix domain-containing protein [Cognatishimia sp. 1_MG-2023]